MAREDESWNEGYAAGVAAERERIRAFAEAECEGDLYAVIAALLADLDFPKNDPARVRTPGHHHLCTCAYCGPS